MEKFGIFELLDALSAVTGTDGAPAAERPPEQTPPPAGPSAPHKTDAIEGFLRRHEALSRKAKKNS